MVISWFYPQILQLNPENSAFPVDFLISSSVKFLRHRNILFSFTLSRSSSRKVKVAWRDIEMKWLGGRPQAIIQMTIFFPLSFNFGSIKLDVEPSAVRQLIKNVSSERAVWNNNDHKEERLSEWWVRVHTNHPINKLKTSRWRTRSHSPSSNAPL